jgi:uncharacterized membrane protein
MFGWNEAAFFVFLFCVLFYFVLMLIYKKTDKFYNRASLDRIYRSWVDARIDDVSHLVTVQTIRNSIMSNSIFISALLLFLSLIVGLFTGEYVGDSADFLGSLTISVGIVQISLISTISIFSLFNFIFSVRMLQRSQLLITANTKKRENIFEKTYNLMQKSFLSAQNYWMGGIRGLFFLIPTITWLFNPIVFLVITILITLYLIGWHDLTLFSRGERE